MTPTEFSTLVDEIFTRWGPDKAWSSPGPVYPMFAEVSLESAVGALDGFANLPDVQAWPPKPVQLKAAAVRRMRERVVPALPETTEGYGWAEFSMRTYGEVIPLKVAVERASVNV